MEAGIPLELRNNEGNSWCGQTTQWLLTSASLGGGGDSNSKIQIKNVALNPSTKLVCCEGDYDSDNDCTSGLKCFMHNGSEPGPPECQGTMVKGWDYCYLSTNVHSASGYFASR